MYICVYIYKVVRSFPGKLGYPNGSIMMMLSNN